MQVQKVVYKNNGENVGTYSPFCFLSSFNGDINETCLRCMNYDNDMQVSTALYSLKDVEIPYWMDESYYLTHWIELNFSACFYKGILESTKVEFENFIKLSEQYKYFIGWILKKKKTKNSFLLSVISQVNTWLNSTDNKYETPLSNKQFEIASKYCPLYEAKSISNYVYNHN